MFLSIHKQIFTLFLLSHLVLAVRFKFSVSDVYVRQVRDMKEDDLLLAVSGVAGSTQVNKTWPLTSVNKFDSIKWDNLTQEIDVPNNANLSIGLGILNSPDALESRLTDGANQFLNGVFSIASLAPGPVGTIASLLGGLLGFLGDLGNCTGPVVVGNVVYSQADLNNFNQNEKKCDNKTYSIESPSIISCGTDNSSYSVVHCLERLDAKSGAASLTPNTVSALVLGLVSVMAVMNL